MADQAKGKGIAPKRASNPADSGQSSRPLPPIRTLLEDKEDSEDYSGVIEVLKHLNTLKASTQDNVSAIKNISSTLASSTNSSNATAATTGKTSYMVEIPSNSIRKEDYRPIIEDAIVSEAIEPKKRYKLRNSPAKGTTLEGIGPSLRGKRPYRPTREPKPLTGTRDLPYVLREPVIEGNKVEKAISSPTLKDPNLALEGELVDLDLDLKGAVSPDPSNLNTEKPISIEMGPSKLEPYESSSGSKLDKLLPDKPVNPVIVESTRPTISIRKPELPEAFP
ncbi:hypothetical protein P8C59_003093 [Phyllachora maydis]|uniref:Uncharacterized protein n=1 Tax=Phyllachora maydis TaxID=1825666 RepID=A0AAD9I127_9PEZI|nr:hypothetical protein P8C59_003093 [Phyllachora maydis]